MLIGLAPNADLSRELSKFISRRLIESLDYVLAAAGDALHIDKQQHRDWIANLRDRRAAPKTHALFHQLVAEIESDDLAGAGMTVDRLFGEDPVASPVIRFPRFDEGSLGKATPELFTRFVDLEEDNRLDLIAATPQNVARLEQSWAAALPMIAENDPELAGELSALVSEFYVAGQADSHRLELGAVSCFEIWGGIFINPAVLRDPLDLVGMVAHECTHFLLFGFAVDEALVLNPPDQKYYSALRDEMRSMDGIYHATLVSARMSAAMHRQRDSGKLDSALEKLAGQRITSARAYYARGLQEIREFGRLTEPGEALLEEAGHMLAPAVTVSAVA